MSFPRYSQLEIAADAAIHGLGIAFALIAGPILIGLVAAHGEAATIAAVSVYVATLIAMLAASAGYNLVPSVRWKDWLRRLDHSAIYLKIAGAYTPFAAVSMGGGAGKILLAAVWATALGGAAMKFLYPRRFEALSIFLYLALGWAAVWFAGDVAAAVSIPALALLAIAGAVYSLGVVFHLWESLPFQNAIWHGMVLAGTALIYAAMAVEFA